MPCQWEFTEYQVRPGIFYWSKNAPDARNRVKLLRDGTGALQAFTQAEVVWALEGMTFRSD